MTFCVECGAEGPTLGGLCRACFQRRHRLVRPPEVLDVRRCQHCGALRLEGGWSDIPLDLAFHGPLQQKSARDRRAQDVVFTYETREEDARNLELVGKATVRVDGWELVEAFATRVRLRPGVCPTCSRRRGRYYEAILQVRGTDRGLTAEERAAVRHRIEARVGEVPTAFVTKLEEVHGGLDVYLSDNGLARALARELRESLGGTSRTSPTLYGRKDGREVYRVTHLVRLPSYRPGDVVRLGDDEYEVVEAGRQTVLRHLATGERRRLRKDESAAARRVDAVRLEAVVVSMGGRELQVLDPETNRPVTVLRPPWLKEGAETVTLVKTAGGVHVVGPPATGKD